MTRHAKRAQLLQSPSEIVRQAPLRWCFRTPVGRADARGRLCRVLRGNPPRSAITPASFAARPGRRARGRDDPRRL